MVRARPPICSHRPLQDRRRSDRRGDPLLELLHAPLQHPGRARHDAALAQARVPARAAFLASLGQTAIAVYIIIVAAIYHFVLRQLWNPQGWQLVADTIEHVVAPALYVIDWLVFVPKGTLTFRSAFVWLAFPFVYAIYSLIHGAVMGFYPYRFLDVAALG
jgi:hypothetical protein